MGYRLKRMKDIIVNKGIRESMSVVARQVVQNYSLPHLPYCLHRVRSSEQEDDLEKLVDFAFWDCGGIIRPLQVRSEILDLVAFLKKIKPKTVLEIGTAAGGTLFLFSRIASEDAVIISIDLPGGRFGGGYPSWKAPIYRSFARPKQLIHLERSDAHSPETFKKVELLLKGSKLDFLFIDGDHTYEGVKKDFESYSPLVKDKGIIAFHDIVRHPEWDGVDVAKFWNKIKENHKYVEFVDDWNQEWGGIGVIRK